MQRFFYLFRILFRGVGHGFWILFWGQVFAGELPPGWSEAKHSAENQPNYCAGGFSFTPKTEIMTRDAKILADEVSSEGQNLRLQGNVKIFYQDIFIETNDALYNPERQDFEFNDNTKIRSPDLLIQGDKVFYDKPNGYFEMSRGFNFDDSRILLSGEILEYYHITGELEADQLHFSIPEIHVWGESKSLKSEQRDGELKITAEQAKLSFCDPTEESWHLKMRGLDLDLENMQGHARGFRLFLDKRPVLFLPYLRFPLGDSRQTGFLYPTFGGDSRNGFMYSQPVYFDIRPNLDSTLSVHTLLRRGIFLEQELRWLTRAGYGMTAVGYLPRDVVKREDRSAYSFVWESNILHGWSGFLEYNEVSDVDYYRDLPATVQPQDDFTLPSVGFVRYDGPRLHWSFGLQSYELLAHNTTGERITPYKQQPFMQLAYLGNLGYGFSLVEEIEYIHFGRPDNEGVREHGVYNDDIARIFNNLGLQWVYTSSQGDFKTDINWEVLRYEGQPDTTELIDDSRQSVSFDGSLIFSTLSNICNCYITLEPRVYGLYARRDSDGPLPSLALDTARRTIGYDNLFNSRHYTGNDRLVSEQRLTFGLQSRLLNFVGGEEYRLRLARAVYLDDRQLSFAEEDATDRLSPWVVDLAWFPGRLSYVQGGFSFDDERILSHHLLLHAYRNARYDVSFSYHNNAETFYQEKAEQMGTGVALQVRDRWSVFGYVYYDLLTRTNVNTLSGFGYENCCLRVVTGGYQTLINGMHETGIVLNLNLKPLGNAVNLGRNRLDDADEIYNSISRGIIYK